MKTVIIEILIALAIAAGGGALVWRYMHAKVAAAEQVAQEATEARDEAIRLRKLDQATLASVAQKKAAIARSGASARASLAAASSPWLDQPLPQEVQDALK